MTDSVLEDFQKELDILGKLRHPNVVLLIGACTNPPNLCMVTEFLNGGSLFDAVHKRKQQFPIQTILKMAHQAACGLNYLHLSTPPIIHRDFKSMNLLLDTDCNAKICDFGLSCVKPTGEVMNTVVGSPFWMAPEVWTGQPYDAKADVYSFGVVLFEMMTGTIPFQEVVTSDPNTMQELQQRVCSGQRCPIPAYVLPDVAQMIMSTWANDQNERWELDRVINSLEESMNSLHSQPPPSPYPNYYFDPMMQQYVHINQNAYYNVPQAGQYQFQQQYQQYMHNFPQ